MRKPGQPADYLPGYRPGFPIAVLQAKVSCNYSITGKRTARDSFLAPEAL